LLNPIQFTLLIFIADVSGIDDDYEMMIAIVWWWQWWRRWWIYIV